MASGGGATELYVRAHEIRLKSEPSFGAMSTSCIIQTSKPRLDSVSGADMTRSTASKSETPSVEGPPGVVRTTIAYNDQLMLCHFTLKKGAAIPLHSHVAAQNGYLIRGKMRLVWETGREFVANPGDGWCFASNEEHRAEILEDSEAIECFTPSRPEYEARGDLRSGKPERTRKEERMTSNKK